MSKLADMDTLKESMISACNIFEKHGIGTMIARVIISIIDSIPCVDAEPVRHGRWTTVRTLMHDGEWYCSACDYEPQIFENTQYCPNCGVKMDGDKSEID